MTFPNPYGTEGRCPVCGAIGACPDGAPVPMPCPPLDLADMPDADTSRALRTYAVAMPVVGQVAHLRLNDADAAAYGDAATPID